MNMQANLWFRCSVLLWLLTGAAALPASAARISIAAVVGDDVITTRDVNERRDLVMASSGIPPTIENQQKLAPRILQILIDETLQLQEAKRNSITITDDEIAKAIDGMGNSASTNEPLREFIRKQGLSLRSLENQVRAQTAWGKVVQRKLRRNVSVSQDEITRAVQAEAAAPGEVELRLSAIEIAIADGKEDAAQKLTEDILLQLKSGSDMPNVAAQYIRQPEVKFTPSGWVAEQKLPMVIQQALRDLKEGDITPPMRSPNSLQVLQLLERKTVAKEDEATEYAVKQITIQVPKAKHKESLADVHGVVSRLRRDPGSCMSDAIPAVNLPTEVRFARMRFGEMSEQQRAVVRRLDVGDVSDPLLGPDVVRLIVMCEKIESAGSDKSDSERIRQQLFAEKIELEAQKLMRNLRRDAFIDIKGAQ